MTTGTKITAYKGFGADWTCRGFQYEVGKTYEHDGKVSACNSGFHACETAIDVFVYYPPALSKFAEVILEGDVSREANVDSKIAGAKITVVAEITLRGFIDRAVKQIIAAAKSTEKKTGHRSAATNTGHRSAATNTGYQSAATNTGYQSAATNTGDRSAATNTGYQSAATNTGHRSAATNTGDRSAATNTGHRSAATNTGYQSAATNTGDRSAAQVSGKASTAMVSGVEGRVMAERDGCSLFANEIVWNGGEYEITSNACGITGRDGIEAGVWYVAKDFKLVPSQ